MAGKCTILQRTFTSTQALHDAGSKIQSDKNSFIARLTTELTAQEADIPALSECLPSTPAFLRGWETATALQTALENQLAVVVEELEMTKELIRWTYIGLFSTAINSV